MMWDLLPLLNPGRAAGRRYAQITFPTRRAEWAHHAERYARWARELPAEFRQAAAVLREFPDNGGDPRTGGGAVVRWERNKWVVRPGHGFRSLRWTPALDRPRLRPRRRRWALRLGRTRHRPLPPRHNSLTLATAYSASRAEPHAATASPRTAAARVSTDASAGRPAGADVSEQVGPGCRVGALRSNPWPAWKTTRPASGSWRTWHVARLSRPRRPGWSASTRCTAK